MKAYVDVGFLLHCLVLTDESAKAVELLRSFEPPLSLNYLHQLLVENFLHHKAKKVQDARGGLQRWRQYVWERVFEIKTIDWDAGFRLALDWNRHDIFAPAPLLILQPALASASGATHFAGFDSRSRKIDKAAGLKLLPPQL